MSGSNEKKNYTQKEKKFADWKKKEEKCENMKTFEMCPNDLSFLHVFVN